MHTNIDIIRLAEGKGKVYSEDGERPLFHLTEPSLIVDRSDRVLAWYLPDAVSSPNQVMLAIQSPFAR